MSEAVKRAFSNSGQINDFDLAMGARGVKPAHINRAVTDPDFAVQLAAFLRGEYPQLPVEAPSIITQPALPSNPYAKEQCQQVWFYPEGFAETFRHTTLETQAERLHKVLGFEPKPPPESQNQSFPTGEFGFDGIGLWPTRQALGRHFGIKSPRNSGYGLLIEAVCSAINASPDLPPLVNYRQGMLTSRHVRVERKTNQLQTHLEKEAERQGCDCLAYPVCFGSWGTKLCYSPRNALWQTLNWPPRRLAIEAVAGLCLLIANPGRLTAYGQLFLDLPGSQYNYEVGGWWSFSLSLYFDGGGFGLYAREALYAHGSYGSLVALPGV